VKFGKDGEVSFELHGKLEALAQLSKLNGFDKVDDSPLNAVTIREPSGLKAADIRDLGRAADYARNRCGRRGGSPPIARRGRIGVREPTATSGALIPKPPEYVSQFWDRCSLFTELGRVLINAQIAVPLSVVQKTAFTIVVE